MLFLEKNGVADPSTKFKIYYMLGGPSICVQEVRCPEALSNVPYSPSVNADLLIYDSKVVYQCGRGRAFKNPDTGDIVQTQDFTCGWDKAWYPGDKVMDCVCKFNLQ